MYRPNIIVHQIATVKVLADKNGICLQEITTETKVSYELYMDGDILNRFYNLKEAMRMFKDFSC